MTVTPAGPIIDKQLLGYLIPTSRTEERDGTLIPGTRLHPARHTDTVIAGLVSSLPRPSRLGLAPNAARC